MWRLNSSLSPRLQDGERDGERGINFANSPSPSFLNLVNLVNPLKNLLPPSAPLFNPSLLTEPRSLFSPTSHHHPSSANSTNHPSCAISYPSPSYAGNRRNKT